MTDATTWDGASLLAEIQRWGAWVQSLVDGATRMVAICEKKPHGLSQDSNLIRDEQGRVWTSNHHRGCYVELVREAPFQAYQESGRTVPHDPSRAYNGGRATFADVTFVAKGWEEPEADWSWAPDRYGMPTLRYYALALAQARRGVAFADAALALTAYDIDLWVARRVAAILPTLCDDPDRRHSLDSDWPHFCRTFALPDGRRSGEELPDHGAISCHLHLAIDRAAGLHHTSYAY